MYKKFIILMLLVSCMLTNAKSQNVNTTIKVQAMEMANALMKKDFPVFLKFMHPNILKLAGGKDKLLQKLDSANQMATQFGASIKKILIGNPAEIITYKKQLQVTLPQTTEMVSGFGNVSLETTLIATSGDGGKSWTFIDTSLYNVKEVKKAMPELSPDLVVPPAKAPKFSPAQQ